MTAPVQPRRWSTTLPRTIAVIAVVSTLAAGGCGGESEMGVQRWINRAREYVAAAPPTNAEMQIDPTAECALVDDVEVAGKRLELFGSGVARFGEIGARYQCAWSGDANASANMRLEVVLIDDAEDYAQYVESLPTRPGNVTVDTDLGTVEVAEYSPAGASRPVTTSVLVVPDQRAGIHLVVELLDPAQSATWSAVDHAHLLDALAR